MCRSFARELQMTLSQVQQSEEGDEFHESRPRKEGEIEGKVLRREDLSWRRDFF